MHAEGKIRVKVLFFAAAKEAAGTPEHTIYATAPATVRTVKEAVFSRFEKLFSFSRSLMVAVNEEYAADDTTVGDLDVVAFLPPVSGG